MPRRQARIRRFDEPYILISIHDSGEPAPHFEPPPNCLGVLTIGFDDIENPVRDKVLFTRAHAHAILDFIFEHGDMVAVIACHCTAGVSRSPAVIAALSELLGAEIPRSDRRGKSKQRPNRHVYEMMLQEGRRHALSNPAHIRQP